jgi:hypothetical protein
MLTLQLENTDWFRVSSTLDSRASLKSQTLLDTNRKVLLAMRSKSPKVQAGLYQRNLKKLTRWPYSSSFLLKQGAHFPRTFLKSAQAIKIHLEILLLADDFPVM